MKKLNLLLASASLAWLTGCSQPGDPIFYPNDENMVGVYVLTEATASGVSLAPAEFSGSIVLTGERTYSIDISIPGMHHSRSGTYHVHSGDGLGPVELDGGDDLLFITDNGLGLAYSFISEGHFHGFGFVRS